MINENRIKILFVDDEVNVLSSLKRGMIDEQAKCFFTTNAFDALKIMAREPIDIIVTDMRMPEMDGLSLLKEIKHLYPGVVKIVLSGYTQLPQILATINSVDIFKFITKPWKMEEEFIPIIHEAIEYSVFLKERKQMTDSIDNKNKLYQGIFQHFDKSLADIQTYSSNLVYTINFVMDLSKKEMSAVKDEKINKTAAVNLMDFVKKVLVRDIDLKTTTYETFTVSSLISLIEKADSYKNNIVFSDEVIFKDKFFGNLNALATILLEVFNYIADEHVKAIGVKITGSGEDLQIRVIRRFLSDEKGKSSAASAFQSDEFLEKLVNSFSIIYPDDSRIDPIPVKFNIR